MGTQCTDCAVMVHCKAGMGRSITSLAVLAMAFVPGLSAAAFFGWVRLARPGSVQTAAQERFLRSLDEAPPACCNLFTGPIAGALRGQVLQKEATVISRF